MILSLPLWKRVPHAAVEQQKAEEPIVIGNRQAIRQRGVFAAVLSFFFYCAGETTTGLWATTEVNPAGADGLFYGGSDLLVAQLISIVVAYALAIIGSFVLFKVVSAFLQVRADESEEVSGLDIVEHGERGYAQSIMTGSPIMGTAAESAMVLQAPFSLPKTCDWQLLREEPLVMIAPARLAGRDPHELLRTEPLIRYDRNQWGGRVADDYLRRAGIVPRERFELNGLNAIAVMVDRGLGVSLVPDWAKPWPEGLDLVRIPLPLPSEPRRIGMVWSRSTVRIRLVTVLLQESRAATGHA